MKYGDIEILDLDFEYKLWKNILKYYLLEIELLNGRLHVLSREQKGGQLDEQNKMTINLQAESIETVKKEIGTQEQEMAFYAEDYPIDTTHMHYIVHEKIRKEMDKVILRQTDIMDKIYPELRYPNKNPE